MMKLYLKLQIQFVLLSLVCIVSGCKNDTRPNILIIMCDDLGYADVGFNGSKDITTPSIDALASEGIIFSSAHVCHPFCGPSRAGLMTGRYPHKIGAQFNLPPHSYMIDEGVSVDETYISKVLQQSGYYTGMVGKWHMGEAERFHPNNRGFDEFFGFLGGGHNYYMDQAQQRYEKLVKEGKERYEIPEYMVPMQHNGKEIAETEYITDAFSREALRFIHTASEKDQPFFLFLAYNAPHTPLQAKKDDLELFSHIQDLKRRNYAAMVYAVDRGVKEIVDALKANRELENTFIVFLSDNGGKVSAGANNYPLRDGKGSTCEGGHRVPMFIKWPDQIEGGQKFTYHVSTLDFYSTFARLAEAKIPDDKVLDGKDILDKLLNGGNPHEHEMIFTLRHREGYSDVGVLKDNWKALRVGEKTWKLYDLEKDLGEEHNLSVQYPAVLESMVKEAEQWSQSNMQPRWFHDDQTGIEWEELQMPRFDQTFKLE